ncbi:hypothetical protein L2Y94_16045 [Luteibacter aegosomatis]|uniref:hypothetical protein n=1 Tax=Luteibacter aegosomatis TaxID=2911537 RepID=UPI001FF9AD4B|nr:hypothetical protein [Luteibacter aegosomatis]UPG84817.1 hypothetical protein L2Y94_16045 [Luteibacter aegosomatis]
MRSSTSNSDIHLTRRYIPGGRWLQPLLAALALALLAVAGLEAWLASHGFMATVVDSPSLWAGERARVNRLGNRALVLVGASRIQLDVDIDTLREMTGKEPVQLAIDGSSFVPVLADLADDDKVTGTILVEYQDHIVGHFDRKDAADVYVAAWKHERLHETIPDFANTEAWLSSFLRGHMRSFADGATPFDSLMLRALDINATQQYLVTLPDRERLADYTKVQMPQFYFARVLRNAGMTQAPDAPDWATLNALLARRIEALPTASLPNFEANSQVIAGMVRRIEARGGRVIFMVFPRSGLVRAADERSFPRAAYWAPFVKAVGTPSLNYADVPTMRDLICPDGSHLDQRDRVAFTRDLVHAMPLLKGGNADVVPRAARSAPSPASLEHAP